MQLRQFHKVEQVVKSIFSHLDSNIVSNEIIPLSSDSIVRLDVLANTFFEIAPDGSMVTKIQGDNYAIYVKDDNIHIKGTCNITVDGNANFYVGGTMTGQATSWNLTGDVNVTGKITATGDVVGGGISLDNHVHGGVKAGSDKTSTPQ